MAEQLWFGPINPAGDVGFATLEHFVRHTHSWMKCHEETRLEPEMNSLLWCALTIVMLLVTSDAERRRQLRDVCLGTDMRI